MRKILILIISIVLLQASIVFVQAQFRTDSNTVTTRIGNPSTTAPPVENSSLRQTLIDKFGITMNGFDSDHLRWTWVKLHEINNPNFTGLLNGSVIQATSGLSSQVGCFGGGTSLNLGQYVPENFFKFILIHELSHIVQACSKRSDSKVVEHANAYAAEGPISYYAGHTLQCTGLNNGQNEDYADTLAYYLNPSAGFSSGPKSCLPAEENNPPNPLFSGSSFQLHLNVAISL
jgi:hypothetical protein